MDLSGKNVAILAAEFNTKLVTAMIEAASDEITQSGSTVADVVRVPGAYELPLLADALLERDDVDALVVLGYIERGETLHGEVMGHVVHAALVDLQLEHRKPMGLGIIGPGATPEQAETRKLDYARAAARAALKNCALLAEH
jgi:6,7-dimethyl-8-ribityllumazine synthase